MPGFFVSDKKITIKLNNRYQERCISESINIENATVERNSLNKFMLDKAFVDIEDLIIILDGYLLNKKQLLEKYNEFTVEQLIVQMYFKEGEQFFSHFRGSFSGVLYDKKQDKWLVYTNHMGDNAVYYAFSDGGFYAGSQVNYVVDACNMENVKLTINEQAAYQMLTFAFMVDDSTFATQIKRLRGGTYICMVNGKLQIKEYHQLHKKVDRFIGKTENEIIDALDKEFRYAIQLEYEKDEEYGYKHLADMSGGLDSRMNAWISHEIKPRHLQLITYCKSGYLDEMISKEIARYWKDELLVKQLDDVSFLYDIDEIVQLNGGLSLYSGITGGKQMLESLNMDKYGLEHTGMIGDVVIGSFFHHEDDNKKKWPSGKYSEKLNERLDTKLIKFRDQFDDHEIFLLYSRALQGAGNTLIIRKNFTEVASPFMYLEFLQLCIDIPVELRVGHYIYKKWIIHKYPNAAKFRWEKTKGKITEMKIITSVRKVITRGPNKLLRMIGMDQKIATGMNPLDYWIANDEDLRLFMNQYVEDAFKYVSGMISKQLADDMHELYSSGNAGERTMVLTVLSAIKMYFGDGKV